MHYYNQPVDVKEFHYQFPPGSIVAKWNLTKKKVFNLVKTIYYQRYSLSNFMNISIEKFFIIPFSQ